jgi:hypothetical protein
MCLRATYSKLWTGKHVPGAFNTQNVLKKKVNAFHQCFSTVLYSMPLAESKQTREE